jgi:hypothetical protein
MHAIRALLRSWRPPFVRGRRHQPPPRLRSRCAWCGAWIGAPDRRSRSAREAAPGDLPEPVAQPATSVSHGLCPSCRGEIAREAHLEVPRKLART